MSSSCRCCVFLSFCKVPSVEVEVSKRVGFGRNLGFERMDALRGGKGLNACPHVGNVVRGLGNRAFKFSDFVRLLCDLFPNRSRGV